MLEGSHGDLPQAFVKPGQDLHTEQPFPREEAVASLHHSVGCSLGISLLPKSSGDPL